VRPGLAHVFGAALALIACAAITPSAQLPPPPSSALRDLLTSARTGDLAGIADALAAGAAVNGVDPNFQQTALMRAAMFGQAPAVGALLRAGASVAPASNLERTALHWAAIGGSADAVRLLVKGGAVVDAPDADIETPLGMAMGHGHVAATEVLLASGADATRAYRSIAYHLGLVLGNRVMGAKRDALRAVIRRGKGLEKDDGAGRTALLVAAAWAHQDGSAEVARELLAAGARPDARTREGQTALEDVRARVAREANPAFKANLDLMLQVLTRGANP
jgi:ankyrin repeat protein